MLFGVSQVILVHVLTVVQFARSNFLVIQMRYNPQPHTTINYTLPFFFFFFFFFFFLFLISFWRGEPLACFSRGIVPRFLVLCWGSVNKLRLTRPREYGRPDILDGCFTAPEESMGRILELE